MIKNLNQIECITLFVEDLFAAKKFYVDIFGLKIIFEDPNCTVVKFENVMVNLLKISEALELIVPAPVGDRSSAARMMFTILVADVDTLCAQLKEHGIALLNGPINRPWGRRTAAFQDPFGNAWELAQEIR